MLGPGPRQRELAAVLKALGAEDPRLLTDLADLLLMGDEPARVVIDSDELPGEDVGILRRFIERAQQELVLLGLDSRAQTPRKVLTFAHTGWMAWPPDLDQLRGLITAPAEEVAAAAAPAPEEEPAPHPAAAGAPATARGEPVHELVPVVPRRSRAPQVPAPADEIEFEPDMDSEIDGDTAAAVVPERHWEGALESDLAEELADTGLVDPELPPTGARNEASQASPALERFEQAYERLRSALSSEDTTEAPRQAEACAAELRHVIEWGRREGEPAPARAAAKPVHEPAEELRAGHECFDLGELLEEVLAGVAVGGSDAPRFLYRASGDLRVVTRRVQLAAAVRSLFRAARSCADSGTVIQVHADHSGEERSVERLRLSVNFPAGLLEQDGVRRILRGGAVPRDLAGIEALTELEQVAENLQGLGTGIAVQGDPFNRLIVELHLPIGLTGSTGSPGSTGSTPKRARPGEAKDGESLEHAASELDPFA